MAIKIELAFEFSLKGKDFKAFRVSGNDRTPSHKEAIDAVDAVTGNGVVRTRRLKRHLYRNRKKMMEVLGSCWAITGHPSSMFPDSVCIFYRQGRGSYESWRGLDSLLDSEIENLFLCYSGA